MNKQEQESTEGLYVVGKTSPHGGYNGFARLPIKSEGGSNCVDKDGSIDCVAFYMDIVNPYVTWFRAEERRAVISLFSRYPKIFERCELVELKKLAEWRAKRFSRVTQSVRTEAGKLSARARCLMVSTLAKSSLSDLTELRNFTGFLSQHGESRTEVKPESSETLALIEAELERRHRMSKEALERIWLEPLGPISYEPLEALDVRKTAPQPGDV